MKLSRRSLLIGSAAFGVLAASLVPIRPKSEDQWRVETQFGFRIYGSYDRKSWTELAVSERIDDRYIVNLPLKRSQMYHHLWIQQEPESMNENLWLNEIAFKVSI